MIANLPPPFAIARFLAEALGWTSVLATAAVFIVSYFSKDRG